MDDGGRRIHRVVENPPGNLSDDEVLAILADRQRRRLLVLLAQLETPERVSALTRTLATELDRTGAEDVERLHIRLYHCHIPKLADAGLVAFDDDENMVELTDEGRTLAIALEE